MNIFWLIAIAQAALIVAILYTGRVRIRGRLLADREVEPNFFRFYVIGFAASLIIVIFEALNPPY